MPYVPNIQDYRPFYIQTANDASAWDTRNYGLVAQTQPYPDNISLKEPYKNDWFDEDGVEEYVSETHAESIEFEVKFYVKTLASGNASPMDDLNAQKSAFRDKIRSGLFKVYDSWHRVGYKDVRFVRDQVDQRVVAEDYAWMIFSVTFKVNDPVTKMALSDGSIVVAV